MGAGGAGTPGRAPASGGDTYLYVFEQGGSRVQDLVAVSPAAHVGSLLLLRGREPYGGRGRGRGGSGTWGGARGWTRGGAGGGARNRGSSARTGRAAPTLASGVGGAVGVGGRRGGLSRAASRGGREGRLVGGRRGGVGSSGGRR